MVRPGGAPSPPEYASGTIIGYMHALLCNKHKQVYRRRYESRRSIVKAQTAFKKNKNKLWRKTIFNMADGIITPCNVSGGYGVTYGIRPNIHHIGILHLV